jgi:SAM-dependent methyltransferase
MNSTEIKNKINSFSRWHYKFDLLGEITPIDSPDKENRHKQREDYFLTPFINLKNGTLKGENILDLGCNAGFWALKCLEAGGDFVLGIDGRKMHIDQAEFVFDVKKIDAKRYQFICDDIYNYFNNNKKEYDIVLCLGLLYHINNPIQLLESINRCNNDILIIDTAVCKNEQPCFIVNIESTLDPRNAILSNIVLVPSVFSLVEILKHLGYKGVVLKPNFSDYSGATDYEVGNRKALICAKKTDLSLLIPKSEFVF